MIKKQHKNFLIIFILLLSLISLLILFNNDQSTPEDFDDTTGEEKIIDQKDDIIDETDQTIDDLPDEKEEIDSDKPDKSPEEEPADDYIDETDKDDHIPDEDEEKDIDKEETDLNFIISDAPLIDDRTQQIQNREVLGFYVNWVSSLANSLDALKAYHNSMDMVAPFWYTLNTDGNIVSRHGGYQDEMVSYARNKDIEILPLINNSQTNHNILINENIRKKAVNNVVDLLKSNNFDGVNIDFEFIPPETKDGYTAFIRKLSEKLTKYDKKLTISVFPKVNVPYSLTGAYDYQALNNYIDRMVIMTYDHNWSTGSPGPIAPVDWVEDNIKYALQYISPDKLLLGIANYGYDWLRSGDGRDLGAKEAKALAGQSNTSLKWDDQAKVPYFHYNDNQGNTREVWFESSYSLKHKLNLVNKYNLRGIGIWRLGNATDRFWQQIDDILR